MFNESNMISKALIIVNGILDAILSWQHQRYQNPLREIFIGKSCHNLTHLPEFSARCSRSLSEIFLGMLTHHRYLLTWSFHRAKVLWDTNSNGR